MSAAIAVENLSKKYLISHQRPERYTALRDVIAGGVSSFGRRLSRLLVPDAGTTKGDTCREDYWALRAVSFEVQEGERVGIIGRNGAGKSTLLKILSRVTEPTSGRISIRGRAASLLEVGTGFHPELTGRENIFLNGAVLGMGKAEIARKFDEIVGFAGVERFLDTPVKRFSSGMYVRLAFAVAAYLDPDILFIDEVLAVGDSAFQQKCLDRMGELSGAGKTIVFVSHNMGLVNSLCNKALWLDAGATMALGEVQDVVRRYSVASSQQSGHVAFDARSAGSRCAIRELNITDCRGAVASTFGVTEPIRICIKYEVSGQIHGFDLMLRISTIAGFRVFTAARSSQLARQIEAGTYVAEVEIPQLFLAPGNYVIDVIAHIPWVESLAYHERAATFSIEETGSDMAIYAGIDLGVVLAKLRWTEKSVAA